MMDHLGTRAPKVLDVEHIFSNLVGLEVLQHKPKGLTAREASPNLVGLLLHTQDFALELLVNRVHGCDKDLTVVLFKHFARLG